MSGRSRSPATALFFEAQLLVVHETPHRPVVDLQPARRELGHQTPQREIAILDPGQQPDAMLVPDRLRLIPADLAGPNTAGLAQPPHPVDRGAHPHPKLCRSLMAGKARSEEHTSELQSRPQLV